MKICHIASEVSPIAKVGGLADVTLGLSREVQKLGHEVFIILPKYTCLKTSALDNLRPYKSNLKTFFAGKWHSCHILVGEVCGIRVYLIDSDKPYKYFDRSSIYGFKDDVTRFAFFSLAALDFLLHDHTNMDVIHIHEWQTALIAPLYHEKYKDKLKSTLIFTIHNLNYQGKTGPALLSQVGLDKDKLFPKLKDPKNPNKINLLKGAILYSDFITTVSPKYAEEIQDPVNGKGLETVILENAHKIKGVLNGIDTQIWNPSLDKALATNYTFETLDKKRADKDYLRHFLKMPIEGESPLVACICRLVPQKGIRMIKKAIHSVLKLKGQFILFGSSPIPKIQMDFIHLQGELKENPNIHFIFESYNEDLAHQIYAAADMLICPSIFEPCGLTQLIALQYGAVPIVRKTGGLANTVFDIESEKHRPLETNGFTFIPPTSKAIDTALKRAFSVYNSRPDHWKELVQRGMQMNNSWEKSAKSYLDIYKLNFRGDKFKSSSK